MITTLCISNNIILVIINYKTDDSGVESSCMNVEVHEEDSH